MTVLKTCKPGDLNVANEEGLTPLALMIQYRRLGGIPSLIRSGANVNLKARALLGTNELKGNNCLGQTALHQVAASGDYVATKLLLGCGADAHAQDKRGRTPFFCAAENGHLSTVMLLSKEKPNINQTSREGKNPLHTLAQQKSTHVLTFLLNRGMSPNAEVTWSGFRPLHQAATSNQPEVIRKLIDYGARLNNVDSWGSSALHYAAYSLAYEAMIALLKTPGIQLFPVNDDGEVPFMSFIDKIIVRGDSNKITSEDRLNMKKVFSVYLEQVKKQYGEKGPGKLLSDLDFWYDRPIDDSIFLNRFDRHHGKIPGWCPAFLNTKEKSQLTRVREQNSLKMTKYTKKPHKKD